jgi:hypothetical protein
MHIKTAVIVLLTAVPLMAANQVHELAPNASKWSGQMRPGGSLQVRGGLSDIDVVASDGDAIGVEVKRGADGSVIPRIIVVETDNGVAVCGDWTTRAGEQSRCGSDKGMYASSRMKNYARADFQISVPVGTSVDAQTNTGNIRIAPLKASVSAKTYEGNVGATADGPKFYGDNLRGNVEVGITPEMMKQKVEADTLTGTVRIVLPETRLIHYEIYTRGAPLFTAYPLAGGPQKAQRGETKEERMYREITKNDYNGSLGPNGKVWLSLEVHVGSDGRVEIDKP